MASKVLTLEINNELIKLCEVSHQGMKNITVNRAVTIPTPEGSVDDGIIKNVQAVSEAIKLALTENLINSKDVIMTILSTKIASKEAVLPNVKLSKVGDMVRANASEYFPVSNIEEYTLTHTVLETVEVEKEKNIRILAMAAPTNVVAPYYDLAKVLGLNVVAVDYLGNSTLQMLKLQIDDAPSMVIQIGNDSTIVNVMKNKVLQFQRTVPYGRSAVVNAVMESKKLSYGVALELLGKGSIVHETFDGDEITESLRFLVNNISRIIDYYMRRNTDSPIEKAYIMGDGATITGIEKLFSNELNIDFAKITELRSVETDKFFRISKTELIQYISTVGACLAPVNFKLGGTKAGAKSSGSGDSMKYFVIGLVASVAVSAVLVAVPLVKYIHLKSQEKEYTDKVASLEGARVIYNEYVASDKMASNIKQYYITETTKENDYLFELMNDLEETLPSDCVINNLTSTEGRVTMSGQCRDKKTLAAVLTQLKGIDYVYNVVTGGGTETKNTDGLTTVSFSVTFQFTNQTDLTKNIESLKEDK